MLQDELRLLREKTGMSRKELARKLGVTEMYIGNFERVPRRGERSFVPSDALLRKIARICGSSDEEKKYHEKRLMLARAKQIAPKEIKEYLEEKIQEFSDSMPVGFVERLKEDIKRLKDSGKYDDDGLINVLTGAGVSEKQLDAVVHYRTVLSREKVIALAGLLKQPVEEYLVLSNYMPSAFRHSIEQGEKLNIVFRRLGNLSAEDIDRFMDVIDKIFSVCREEVKDEGKK